jgi:hypothetical protein
MNLPAPPQGLGLASVSERGMIGLARSSNVLIVGALVACERPPLVAA